MVLYNAVFFSYFFFVVSTALFTFTVISIALEDRSCCWPIPWLPSGMRLWVEVYDLLLKTAKSVREGKPLQLRL